MVGQEQCTLFISKPPVQPLDTNILPIYYYQSFTFQPHNLARFNNTFGSKNVPPGFYNYSLHFVRFLLELLCWMGFFLVFDLDPSQMQHSSQQWTDHAHLMSVGDEQRPSNGSCRAALSRCQWILYYMLR